MIGGVLIGAVVAAGLFASPWGQSLLGGVFAQPGQNDDAAKDPHAAAHASEDSAAHNHAAESADSVELSPQAQKNIGLELITIEPRDFQRTVSIPAVLVDRPGRTEMAVAAPMTGIVRRVHATEGEAVAPGTPLFEIRLTHEDLVDKQSQLLQAVEELDVVKREVARLEEVTRSGAVAGKRLLERQYEQQKIEAVIRAQRQALVLHGLAKEQVAAIIKDRRLLQSVTIRAPELADCGHCGKHKEVLQVAALNVAPGQHVETGARLCTLTDHCELYVEGKAFQNDADVLTEAANKKMPVTAVIQGNGSKRHEVPDLKILYIENQVDVESRALKFYLQLPNKIVRDEQTPDGRHFIGWRYRPGQRVDVLVPVERWKNRIVLPVDAVVQDGPDWFVYQEIAKKFRQKPVHVEYRDQRFVVIENDGTLFPGDVVAGKGAYQISLALKNRSGAVDPHAGHNH
jgi:multidrug efflux pump subunit AcrA (membrane-fusion protein)